MISTPSFYLGPVWAAIKLKGKATLSKRSAASWAGWAGPSLRIPTPSIPAHTDTVPEFREENEKRSHQMVIRCCQSPVETLGRMPRTLTLSASFPLQGRDTSLKCPSKTLTGPPFSLRWNNSEVLYALSEVPNGLNPSCWLVNTSYINLLPFSVSPPHSHLPNK